MCNNQILPTRCPLEYITLQDFPIVLRYSFTSIKRASLLAHEPQLPTKRILVSVVRTQVITKARATASAEKLPAFRQRIEPRTRGLRRSRNRGIYLDEKRATTRPSRAIFRAPSVLFGGTYISWFV